MLKEVVFMIGFVYIKKWCQELQLGKKTRIKESIEEWRSCLQEYFNIKLSPI